MKKGVREVRDHFTRYLKQVREGRTITITEHGRAIAQLTALPVSETVEARLERLERQGLLRLPVVSGTLPPLPRNLPKRGPSLRELVLREREEGW
jgi:prevent-host-death family protein